MGQGLKLAKATNYIMRSTGRMVPRHGGVVGVTIIIPGAGGGIALSGTLESARIERSTVSIVTMHDVIQLGCQDP